MKHKPIAGKNYTDFLEIPSLDIHGASEWKLEERLVYRSRYWPELIIVPAGFITDLASIPRIFRALIPQNGKHRLAAIVHDYLVRLDDFDRRLADRIFLEAMEHLGVKRWRRYSMFWAVGALTTWLKLRGKA